MSKRGRDEFDEYEDDSREYKRNKESEEEDSSEYEDSTELALESINEDALVQVRDILTEDLFNYADDNKVPLDGDAHDPEDFTVYDFNSVGTRTQPIFYRGLYIYDNSKNVVTEFFSETVPDRSFSYSGLFDSSYTVIVEFSFKNLDDSERLPIEHHHNAFRGQIIPYNVKIHQVFFNIHDVAEENFTMFSKKVIMRTFDDFRAMGIDTTYHLCDVAHKIKGKKVDYIGLISLTFKEDLNQAGGGKCKCEKCARTNKY